MSCGPDAGATGDLTAEFLPHALPAGVAFQFEDNGRIVPRSWDFRAESPDEPALDALRGAERLDDVIAGAADEWDAMVRLARWTSAQWRPGKPDPYPPWDARVILREIRAGRTGGFCAQYAVVLVQGLLALGHTARYLELATADGQGHVSVEVWSNQFDTWAVLDPFFAVWVEFAAHPGRPLSALEIHRALAEDRAGELTQRPLGADARRAPERVEFLPYFADLAVSMRNDHLSRPLHAWNRQETYLSWTDGSTDGRPEVFRRLTEQELDFAFPLNQVQVTLHGGSEPDQLLCGIRTNMLDAEAIRVLLDDGSSERIDVDAEPAAPGEDEPAVWLLNPTYGLILVWTWDLHAGRNSASFRAVGPTGIEGPPARFEVHLASGS